MSEFMCVCVAFVLRHDRERKFCSLFIVIHEIANLRRTYTGTVRAHGMFVVRILNLRGRPNHPPHRVPIDLGRPCLKMAQVLYLLRERVMKLDQLAQTVHARIPPSWKPVGPNEEHRAQRVCLVHMSSQVQDKSLCILPVLFREVRADKCASCAVCVAVFHVNRTWKTKDGHPVNITVDVVGLPKCGVAKRRYVQTSIRNTLKPLVLRIAGRDAEDLSRVRVRFTSCLSKGERTTYAILSLTVLLTLMSTHINIHIHLQVLRSDRVSSP